MMGVGVIPWPYSDPAFLQSGLCPVPRLCMNLVLLQPTDEGIWVALETMHPKAFIASLIEYQGSCNMNALARKMT